MENPAGSRNVSRRTAAVVLRRASTLAMANTKLSNKAARFTVPLSCTLLRMMTRRLRLSAVSLVIGGVAFAQAPSSMPDVSTLQTMTARFAPTDIGADLSKLSAADRRVLAKLVEAARVVDALFLRQVWSGNDAMLLELA